MKYCPSCLAEYEERISDCPDCEVPLVNSLTEERKIHGFKEAVYAAVLKDADAFEGQMVKSLLESNGIPCKVLGALQDGSFPMLPVEVQVPKDREEEAKELIAAYQNNPATDLGN
jgi:D-alanine-D-alanine ligase-like ATP-grasp enzyme